MDMMENFKAVYLEESFEGLDIMESGLLDLPIGMPPRDDVDTIFRAAHSIKGGSGTFGFSEISGFTHVMETLLDEIREGQRELTQEGKEALLQSVDTLRNMMEILQNGETIEDSVMAQAQGSLEAILGKSASADEVAGTGSNASDADGTFNISFKPKKTMMQVGNDPLRFFIQLAELGEMKAEMSSCFPDEFDPEEIYLSWKLELKAKASAQEEIDEVFEWLDEDDVEISMSFESDVKEDAPSVAKPKAEKANTEPKTSKAAPAAADKKPKSDSSIRVSLSKIDSMVNLVGELVTTQAMLAQFGSDVEAKHGKNDSDIERLLEGLSSLEKQTRDLQEGVLGIRMLPVSFAFNRMPRIVHDVSKKLGKNINLIMEGENTELDKTMIESLTDPLVHIIRNSLDHGIEMPNVRSAAGKPEDGTVWLSAAHQGGNIVITITDDGAGVNVAKVKEKAIEKGVINASDSLQEHEIVDLIFHPGFSTADEVSDISGRGVGMDVVRRNIKALGGSIEVVTEAGKGSTFTIKLPLTLSIMDGQLVKTGDETFVFPIMQIIETIQCQEENLKEIADKGELYKYRDGYIPLVRLSDTFEVKPASKKLEDGLLVIVNNGSQVAGVWVDSLLGQQQVVIKSLETNYKKLPGIAGATILGNGMVSLILDLGTVISGTEGVE